MEPSTAVARQAHLGPNWCLVIVLDKKSPADYKIDGLNQEEEKRVTYLDIEAQEAFRLKWDIQMVSKLPWNSFGRKNVGYLYAIANGARNIWDFDDDNLLIKEQFQVPGMKDKKISFKEAKMHNFSTFNCYPVMGSTHKLIWPRGLPLNHIKNEASYLLSKNDLVDSTITLSSVAVIQSLANQDPDVDAIYRLALPLPVNFEGDIGNIAVPVGSYAPLNAQAALFLESALPMLFLPISVHGRVSDIWRGYILERICKEMNKRILMTSPLVVQVRNPHSAMADFQSEQDLYLKSEALINVLGNMVFESTDIPYMLEKIYIEMCKRRFIEEEDVYLVQEWLLALQTAGYTFSDDISPLLESSVKTPMVSTGNTHTLRTCQTWPDLKLFLTMDNTHFEEFLEIFMRSLKFFWPLHLLDLVVVMDKEAKDIEIESRLREETACANSFKIEYNAPSQYYGGKGYDRQQLVMFWADNFTKAEFIGFVDTDTLFVAPVYEGDLFVNGKPVIIAFFDHHSGGPYESATRDILGKPEVVRCMSYFPALIRTRHLKELRDYIETIHNITFNEYFRSMATTQNYSQFVIMCNYLWYFHCDEYDWSIQELNNDIADKSNLGFPINQFTSRMMQPKPRISIHFKRAFYKRRREYDEKYFVSYILALGFCYDVQVRPVDQTFGICSHDNIHLGPVNWNMYRFHRHSWLHHPGTITSFQARQGKLRDCEPHKWNRTELQRIYSDISKINRQT